MNLSRICRTSLGLSVFSVLGIVTLLAACGTPEQSKTSEDVEKHQKAWADHHERETSRPQPLKALPTEMSDSDRYILEAIRKWVWSGFYSQEEVDYMIGDILDDDANEEMLRAAVAPEFDKKKKAETGWPETTDCDRLDDVFQVLDSRGILCLNNAGYEMSDGHQEAFEVLSDGPKEKYFGYCFYHGQDVEHAIDGHGLMLAFDHVDGDVPDKLKVGLIVKQELERAGFVLDWKETTDERIGIPQFEWKRRRER